jgi:uncharacterized protein (DUF39 family)
VSIESQACGVSPPATRPPPQVERLGRRIRVAGGEGVAVSIGSQRQREERTELTWRSDMWDLAPHQ